MSVATSSNQLATSWILMSLGIGKSQFPEMLGVTGMNWAIILRNLHGERFDQKVVCTCNHVY